MAGEYRPKQYPISTGRCTGDVSATAVICLIIMASYLEQALKTLNLENPWTIVTRNFLLYPSVHLNSSYLLVFSQQDPVDNNTLISSYNIF